MKIYILYKQGHKPLVHVTLLFFPAARTQILSPHGPLITTISQAAILEANWADEELTTLLLSSSRKRSTSLCMHVSSSPLHAISAKAHSVMLICYSGTHQVVSMRCSAITGLKLQNTLRMNNIYMYVIQVLNLPK